MPVKTALTDRAIAALKTDKQTQFYDESFSAGCFGVQVGKTGIKTFFLIYRLNNRKKWLALGRYPQMKLKDARQAAIDALAKVSKGEDPAGQVRAYKQSETFRDLAEEFLEKRGRERNWAQSTRRDFRSMLSRDLYPRWEDVKARDIKKGDILSVLETIAYGRNSAYLANRTKELVHSIFAWAVKRDMLQHNPAIGIDDFSGEKPRDRFLSAAEIKALWKLSEELLDTQGRAFFHLLLVWGMRPGEVMKLKWSYFEQDRVTLPGSITKNRKPLTLYVPEVASTELELLRQTSHSEFLFPGARQDDHRHSFTTAYKAILKAMGGDPWQLRDIRRTVETQMVKAGIPRGVADLILNHGDSGMTARHYDWHDYFPEKKSALLKWEQALRVIVSGEGKQQKVVNFPGTISNP